MKSKLYARLFCSLFLTSCSQVAPPPTSIINDPIDRGIFTGVPCAVPCWHGLQVGKSVESEVMSTLQQLDYIDEDTIQITRRASGVEIIASCSSPARECLKFDVANDVLAKIVVGIHYEIRVDEAIEQLGEPNYLGVSTTDGGPIACEMQLIWRNSGLVLASTVAADSEAIEKHCEVVSSTGKIPPGLLIAEARLISGIELVTLLTSGGQLFQFLGTQPAQ